MSKIISDAFNDITKESEEKIKYLSNLVEDFYRDMTPVQMILNEFNKDFPTKFNTHNKDGRDLINKYHVFLEIETNKRKHLKNKIREVYKLINYQNIEFEWNEKLRQGRKILNEIGSEL